jgi:Ion channel
MDQWGTLVTGLSGFAFFVAAIVALVLRKWRLAGYLAVTGYILLWPIHLWFWQFELPERAPLPHWYFWSAVQQIVLGGIAPLIWFCFRRFRPVVTALFLAYVLSLLLQLFSYMYWAYGTTRNFSIRLSHLDSFYFALGTLTTAGTGNISAISETARRLQTLQMGLDLVLIGFVVALALARYSNLLNRPQVGLARDNAMTATPRPVADRSDQPQHASAPNAACSDHPGPAPQSDTQDRQRCDGDPGERRILDVTQPDRHDRGQEDDSEPLK